MDQYCKFKIKDPSLLAGDRYIKPSLCDYGQTHHLQNCPGSQKIINFLQPLREAVYICGDPAKTILSVFLVFLSVGIFNLICFNFPDNGVPLCYHFTQGRSFGVQTM